MPGSGFEDDREGRSVEFQKRLGRQKVYLSECQRGLRMDSTHSAERLSKRHKVLGCRS